MQAGASAKAGSSKLQKKTPKSSGPASAGPFLCAERSEERCMRLPRFETRQLRSSDPQIVCCGPIAALVAGVHRAARLDQHHADLVLGERLVFDTLGHDVELTRPDGYLAVAEVDPELPLEDEERLVGFGVA